MRVVVIGLVGAVLALTAALPGQASVNDNTRTETEPALWQLPVRPPLVVLRGFRAPASPYGSGHRGVDLHARAGITVHAPASGVVHFAGWVVDRPVLSIDHGAGLVSSFEPVDALVEFGEPVQAGQPIGEVAEGAHCAVGCLHVGLRLHGEYVSPLLVLGEVPRAVLLPLH